MSGSTSSRPIGIAAVTGLAVAITGIVWLAASRRPSPLVPTETPEKAAIIRRDLIDLERAAIRFARAAGHLPESLSNLVPAQLPRLPKDPYGREYVLRGGGPGKIYIWSLGADGRLARYPPDVAAIVTMDEVRASTDEDRSPGS